MRILVIVRLIRQVLDDVHILEMGEKMSNKIITIILVLIATMAGVISSAELPPLESPTANLTEKWVTNNSGWTVATYAKANCGWTNGAMGVSLLPDPGDGFARTLSIMAKLPASQGIFVGNYSKIEAINFDLELNNLALIPVLYFKSISGASWRYSLGGVGINGQKVNVNIPFVYSAKWAGGNESFFNIDKANITEVGFQMTRGANDVAAQAFSVDNFKLVGAWGGPSTNGVPLAWLLEYGVTDAFAIAGTANSDGDAFSNAEEFMAGTDPMNSNSFFKIRIEKNDQGKMVVRWAGNRDVKYSVLEASSLGPEGGFLEKTNLIPATVKAEEVVVDQVGGGPKFYKVTISPNPAASGN